MLNIFSIDDVIYNPNFVIPEIKSPFVQEVPSPLNPEFYSMYHLDLMNNTNEFNIKLAHHQEQADRIVNHIVQQDLLNAKMFEYGSELIGALNLTNYYKRTTFVQSLYTIARFSPDVLASNKYQHVKFFRFCDCIEYIGEGQGTRAESHKTSHGVHSNCSLKFRRCVKFLNLILAC